MMPMTGAGQTTLFSQVECAPSASTWRYRDYWGTQVSVFDLQRPHQQLRVTATSLVETASPPSTAPAAGWDVLRDASTVDEWCELLAPTPLTTVSDETVRLVRDLVGDATPLDAARAVADWVRETVAYVPGSTGVRTSAQEAYSLGKGVCQDIAHLTVALLRGLGIPARYVSGYLYPKADGTIGDTVAGQSHAWVEWWCGEWAGFDPTNGVPLSPRHVLVARGRDYDDVPPLKGVYHGAPSTGLGVTVEITRLA